MKYLKTAIILVISAGLLACKDKITPANPDVSSVSNQSETSAINVKESQTLFGLISQKELGDVHGRAEMRNKGILIHPGATTPTRVSFDVTGKYETVVLDAFIDTLPPEALAIKEAGTVRVEFFVDGKSAGYAKVDRSTNYEKALNLKGAKTLSVVVDNSDGKPWFDWLVLRLK